MNELSEVLTLRREVKELQQALDELEIRNRMLEERILEIFALYNVSKALSHTFQLEELFKITIHMMTGPLQVNEFGIYLYDPKIGRLNPMVIQGPLDATLSDLQMSPNEGILGEAFRRGQLVSVETSGATNNGDPWTSEPGYTVVAVPLRSQAEDTVGCMILRNRGQSSFAAENMQLFESIGSHVAIAIENARIYQQTKERSFLDPVTQIYNERYIRERLQRETIRADRYSQRLQVMVIELRGLQQIAAKKGQTIAHRILREAAEMIRVRIRRSDIVGRLEDPDRFVVMLPETDPAGALHVAQELSRAIGAQTWPYSIKDAPAPWVATGLSSLPQDGNDPEVLLRLARERVGQTT